MGGRKPVTRSITYTVMKILLELSKPSLMTKARLGFMYLKLSPKGHSSSTHQVPCHSSLPLRHHTHLGGGGQVGDGRGGEHGGRGVLTHQQQWAGIVLR